MPAELWLHITGSMVRYRCHNNEGDSEWTQLLAASHDQMCFQLITKTRVRIREIASARQVVNFKPCCESLDCQQRF